MIVLSQSSQISIAGTFLNNLTTDLELLIGLQAWIIYKDVSVCRVGHNIDVWNFGIFAYLGFITSQKTESWP